ncbi:hypothetical protein HJD18_13610 [Thermoleophilia bacterium SCSIO 60948]|nr:hypothetical protein HJD18_13610 [Thermoleophilia bacterium SCSIO 60948]
MVALRDGGSNDPHSNGIALCGPCHRVVEARLNTMRG